MLEPLRQCASPERSLAVYEARGRNGHKCAASAQIAVNRPQMVGIGRRRQELGRASETPQSCGCRHHRASARDTFAVQKVTGSSPVIRFAEKPRSRGVSVEWATYRAAEPWPTSGLNVVVGRQAISGRRLRTLAQMLQIQRELAAASFAPSSNVQTLKAGVSRPP